jgi:hypothetical protein
MSHITLTEDQARVLKETTGSIEIRDPHGRVLTFARALDPALVDTILECKRRLASGSPRIPSSRVKAFLQRCTEIDQTEGMTPEKMEELLRRVKGGEPV